MERGTRNYGGGERRGKSFDIRSIDGYNEDGVKRSSMIFLKEVHEGA